MDTGRRSGPDKAVRPYAQHWFIRGRKEAHLFVFGGAQRAAAADRGTSRGVWKMLRR
jgi:hypothetical protein